MPEPALTPTRVDFSYAFAPPHRLTVALPDSGRKTLLDLKPGSLRMAWSDEDLSMYPFAALKIPPTTWELLFKVEIDEAPVEDSCWTRAEGWLPVLENEYARGEVSLQLQVCGAETAALARVRVANLSDQAHRVVLRCEKPGKWNGVNPGWVNPRKWKSDHLLAGWLDRADRILVLGIGADSYSLRTDGAPPNANSLVMVWDLQPGESRSGWVVRPYRAYASGLADLRASDWQAEETNALKAWRDLINRSSQIVLPDPGVRQAFLACLADLFIMREPVPGGRIAAVPGTEGYRAAEPFEPAIVAVALDQFGYHQEAMDGYIACLEQQEPDGNWAEPQGWAHWMWGAAGFKAWAGMQHYHLTGDRTFLANLLPRLAASTLFQENERAETRFPAGEEPALTSGLMPPGMGDCGLLNDEDFYGVFFPHNIWAVYADRQTLEAARILKESTLLAELRPMVEQGEADLLRSLDAGAIREEGYRWIPGVPGKTCGSRWGVLNALTPCHILPPDHDLIEGTLRKIESRISPGGIPVHTGWMKDGMWVAIALDNLAEAHLARGEGDAAAAYLLATLNHGTPLHSWCEERGQDPGSKETAGDLQHLWTPVAVVRCIRDMLVLEDGKGLHLGLGADRGWLASGKPLGMTEAPTHFGRISYSLQYDMDNGQVRGQANFTWRETPAWVQVHIRLPGGMRITLVQANCAVTILPGAEALLVENPGSQVQFVAEVGA